MVTKKTTSRKPRVLHSVPCSQQSLIERLDLSMHGDGNGTKGMKFDVHLIKEHLKEIDFNIGKINDSLSAKSEIETALEVERQVQIRVAIIEKERVEADNIKLDKKYSRRGDVRGFVLMAVAIISLLITFWKINSDNKSKDVSQNQTTTKQDTL